MSDELLPDEEQIKLLEKQIIMDDYNLKAMEAQIKDVLKQLESLRIKKANAELTIERSKSLLDRKKKDFEEKKKLELEKSFEQRVFEQVQEIAKEYPIFEKARHYQYEDILETVSAYMQYPKYGGMLNANDIGAGKTMETVLTLMILIKMFHEENGRWPKIAWLTKLSLVLETPLEIKRWWPELKVAAPPMSSKLSMRQFAMEIYASSVEDGPSLFLTNYEFVRTTPEAMQFGWDFLIVDEVHKLKGGANNTGPTAIWTAVKDLSKVARFKMFLTGTPMVNDPQEMWSYLHIFKPDAFPDLKHFRRVFMTYKEYAGEMQLTVDPNRILNQALKGQMIRRSRKEFGIELPPETVEEIRLQMVPEQREVYDQMRTRFFVWLDEQTNMLSATAIIAQMTRLRQLNLWPPGIEYEYASVDNEGNPIMLDDEMMTFKKKVNVPFSSKIDEAMDRIELITSVPSSIDDSISEQIIVGCTMNPPLHEIRNRCRALGISCEVISGENKSPRNFAKEFQDGKIQVLCINSAMGEGLNLQKNPEQWIGGANYSILLDKWWNPSRQIQFWGRIGGTRAHKDFPVTHWVLINDHSIDGYIQAMNTDKEKKFNSIMDSDIIRPKGEWKEYLEKLI